MPNIPAVFGGFGGTVRRIRMVDFGARPSGIVPSASAYTGLGDVVGGAAAYWGLRAYTLASIGANAVRLRENGGNTESDFATIAGGGLDLTAISTFKGANSLFVVKLYDQTGNGRDATQATAANQPAFALSAIGSLPGVTYASASTQQLNIASLTTGAPLSISAVINPTGANFSAFFGANTAGSFDVRAENVGRPIDVLAAGAANLLTTTVNLANGTWYAVGAEYDGSNVAAYVNATAKSGVDATGVASSSVYELGAASGESNWDGQMPELGLYLSYLSAGDMSSLSANQRTYWGF